MQVSKTKNAPYKNAPTPRIRFSEPDAVYKIYNPIPKTKKVSRIQETPISILSIE